MRKFLQKIVQILDGTPANYGKNRQRGQSLIELAFITPILIIMVAGIVEIGWYANNYISLLEAAKVGARRGPFLNGDNAPQLFPDDASIAPNGYASSGYLSLPPLPVDATAANDPRYRTRGLTFPPVTNQCGEGIAPDDVGFYNIIACTVLDSLDPLTMRTGINPRNDKPFRDDIVISVFSIQAVNNCPKGQTNPDDPKPETNKCDKNINQNSSTIYPVGHQVVVVGRYPSNANECAGGGATEERDPFDYITNNNGVDRENVSTPTGNVLIPFEISIPLYNASGAVYDFDPFADPVPAYGDSWLDENQRGWSWTGQHKVDTDDGYTGGDCYGSDFTSAEVQELMNLPQFVETDKASAQDRLSYIPSQGMVLVEVFWEHDLLMGEAFPLFYGAYNLFGDLNPKSGGNLIRVWSAFPAAAAEPHIIYNLDS